MNNKPDIKKIIAVNATASRYGGALTILRQFIEAIPADGFQYILFVDDSFSGQNLPDNTKIVRLNKRAFAKRFLWDAFGLKKWLKANNIKPFAAVSLQNTNFRLNKLCPNFIYYHQPVPLFPYKWNPLKKQERILWFYKNIYPLFVKLFLNSKTEIFVQLEYIKEKFSERFNFPKNKIHVVFPNVLLPQIQQKNRNFSVNIDRKKFNIFYPAISHFYKNHEILFKAFNYIDKQLSVPLVLYLTVNEDFTDKYLFRNIEIVSTGQISHSNVCEYYANIDALVFPSYIETLGLPLIEAASFGLPVIAADLPYSREVLNGYDGVNYVDYKNAEAWGNAILQLVSKSGQKYKPFNKSDNSSWDRFFKIITQKQ